MFHSNIKFFLAFFAATMIFAVVQAYAVWQDAPAAPAQYGSPPCPDLDGNLLTYEPCLQDDYKPVNLGTTVQTKTGGLNIMGNVGIGTTGPLTKLHVVGGDYSSGARIESSDNYGSGIGLKNTSTGGRHFNIFSTGASNGEGAGKLAFQDNAVGARMIIDSAGNVGIGTTTPGDKLHVVGSLRLDSGSGYIYRLETADRLQFTSNGADVMAIKGSNVGIGTTGPLTKLHVVGGDYSSGARIESSDNYGSGIGFKNTSAGGRHFVIFSTGASNGEGAGKLSFLDNAVGTRMIIDSAGNVGIGTTNPGAYKLNVVGDANVTRLCIADDCKNSWAAVTSGSGSVTSVTAGAGLFASPNPITTTGTISLNFSSANNWSAVQTFSGGANFPGNGFWNSSGNVGIGTTGPLTKLHVVGGDYSSGARIESSDNYGSGIGLKNTSTGGRHFNIFSTGASNGEGAGKLAFQDNAVGTRMIIDSAGNVGIGTTDPGSYRLNVVGDIYTSGSGTAAGGWYVSSDARLKKNVETLSGALEKLGRARGVSYDLASGQGARQIGVIAQELEQEFPELVKTDDNGYKVVAYDRLSAVLIEAIKELKTQNQILQQRLDLLEKKW